MKKLLFLVTFLFMVVSARAQEVTVWNKAKRILTKPANIDTMCVYQPRACFSLGVFSTAQRAGFHTDVKFGVYYPDDEPVFGISHYNLSENICKKVGLEVGYGNIGLGYGLEVGSRSAWKKSSFAFNFLGKTWGLRFNYFKITNPFTTGLTIGDEGDGNSFHDEFTTTENSILKNLAIDGYYVFNNKRFAYSAAYKMGFVQRRTAGSWMLTARYMQGSLYNSPEATWMSYNLLDCFSTLQASVGGGYSVNFVPWHRDPTDVRDHGLRNLTINLTAMPVITLLNYLKCSYYENENEVIGEKVFKVYCLPMPNYVGSAALSLTFGRLYFSTQFTYNWFYFRSRDAFDSTQLIPDHVDDLNFSGSFHDWTLKGIVVYRF